MPAVASVGWEPAVAASVGWEPAVAASVAEPAQEQAVDFVVTLGKGAVVSRKMVLVTDSPGPARLAANSTRSSVYHQMAGCMA